MNAATAAGWRGAAAAVVVRLGLAQTLAWASSFYLPAVLAVPMARDCGVAPATVYAAFSLALVLSALLGPAAGRAVDRHGGRPVLVLTSLGFAAGLALLAFAAGPWSLVAAWALLGVAMGAGLYDTAFAALVRLYGTGARGPITGITLIAGFASTVGWPLSAWMEQRWGWRGACLGWAGLHLLAGLPLNAWLPRAAAAAAPPGPTSDIAGTTNPAPSGPAPEHGLRATVLLAFAFAAVWFVATAMAAHLPRLLQATGATLAAAVAAGALIGPAQVAARLLEFGALRRVNPLVSARLAALALPLAVGVLLLAGPGAAPLFAILHGAGVGILTIAKGTLPLLFFGAQGYGARQGWLSLPSRVAVAAAPVLYGLALDRWDAGALWLSLALVSAAAVSLLLLRAPPAPR